MGLSLLLGSMAKKCSPVLSATERKELVLGSDTTNDADPDPLAKICA
jgi:hypothetical protein